jgi:hypothetical protein
MTWVLVVVVEVDTGAVGTTWCVVVCSVVVVRVGDEQAPTSATVPSSRPASSSRDVDLVFVLVMTVILFLSATGARRAPGRLDCLRGAGAYGVEVDFMVVVLVVLDATGGYVVVLVVLSFATPLLFL